MVAGLRNQVPLALYAGISVTLETPSSPVPLTTKVSPMLPASNVVGKPFL